MRSISFTVGGGFALLWLFLTSAGSLAQEVAPVERLTKKDGVTLAVQGGKTEKLRTNVTLPGGIAVTTNGTFRVNQGKERLLQEGQVLNKDGTLASPDGTLVPVVDHVAMKNGRIVVVKDGEPSALPAETTLADGTRVSPDGTITERSGRRTRLLDGQVFKLDGAPLPARDTITLKDGKVIVQKDGSLLPVAPGRSIMMSDGTKVLSDGTVIKRDGAKVKLAEGETRAIEGVARRGP